MEKAIIQIKYKNQKAIELVVYYRKSRTVKFNNKHSTSRYGQDRIL